MTLLVPHSSLPDASAAPATKEVVAPRPKKRKVGKKTARARPRSARQMPSRRCNDYQGADQGEAHNGEDADAATGGAAGQNTGEKVKPKAKGRAKPRSKAQRVQQQALQAALEAFLVTQHQ